MEYEPKTLKTLSILAIAAIGFAAIASTLGVLVTSQSVGNSGSIVKTIGVSVFSDSQCQNALTTINWGTLGPNTSAQFTIYVRNNGTAAESLTMSTSNWNPTLASSYITLTWNRQNYVLNHQSSVSATLTLAVSPSIVNVTSFSFDITITGTEN